MPQSHRLVQGKRLNVAVVAATRSTLDAAMIQLPTLPPHQPDYLMQSLLLAASQRALRLLAGYHNCEATLQYKFSHFSPRENARHLKPRSES